MLYGLTRTWVEQCHHKNPTRRMAEGMLLTPTSLAPAQIECPSESPDHLDCAPDASWAPEETYRYIANLLNERVRPPNWTCISGFSADIHGLGGCPCTRLCDFDDCRTRGPTRTLCSTCVAGFHTIDIDHQDQDATDTAENSE